MTNGHPLHHFQKNIIPTACIILSLAFLLILGRELFELVHLKNTVQILKQLQLEKEKQLSKRLETSSSLALLNKKIVLNTSTTLFTLAKLCESSHLTLSKLHIKKTESKTEDPFEVSLDLWGEYFYLLAFIEKLHQLPYLAECKALTLLKKPNTQHPLEIKLKLLLSSVYFPAQKTCQKISPQKKTAIFSPFLIRHYVGKIKTPAHLEGHKIINQRNMLLLAVEDPTSGTCILQQKLEYSPESEE